MRAALDMRRQAEREANSGPHGAGPRAQHRRQAAAKDRAMVEGTRAAWARRQKVS